MCVCVLDRSPFNAFDEASYFAKYSCVGSLCKGSLVRSLMHLDQVLRTYFFDRVFMNVERLSDIGFVKLVDLSLLLQEVLSHLLVCQFSHAQRLIDVFSHLLLLQVHLPLLYLEVLLMDLVHVEHHLFVGYDCLVLFVHLLLRFPLASLHVFKLDLAGYKRTTLSSLHVTVTNLNEAVRFAWLEPSSLRDEVRLRGLSLQTTITSLDVLRKQVFEGFDIHLDALV